MPRPKGSADLLEHRRRRALALLGEGRSLHEVARLIACAASSAMRWRDARASGGTKALKVRTSPGRPPKLGKRDYPRLVRHLLKGAIVHGYPTDLWTTTRIARLIRQKFGVRYHGDRVGRPMHRIGWSHRKPERRALERDEAAIAHRKRREWPRVKKPLPGWAPTSYSSMNRGSC